MGKAAIQRRIKRMKYLARIAREEPELFETKWEKRVSSWLEKIRNDAGNLRDKDNQSVHPVFEHVEEAMAILINCGEETYRRYAGETYELLSMECCKYFAGRVDYRLFKINNYHGFDELPST